MYLALSLALEQAVISSMAERISYGNAFIVVVIVGNSFCRVVVSGVFGLVFEGSNEPREAVLCTTCWKMLLASSTRKNSRTLPYHADY